MRVLAAGTARLSTSARPAASTAGAAEIAFAAPATGASSVTVPPPASPLAPGLPGSSSPLLLLFCSIAWR